MKRLESSLNKQQSPHQSLRSLFLHDIHVDHIAEELVVCQADERTANALHIMDTHDFDCLGVEENGKVIGYIEKHDLGDGICRDNMKSFITTEVVSDSTSLLKTLYLFKETKRIFVLEENRISKLVTHADLQKAPVQLFLFGLVSLTEMYLLQWIKKYLPYEEWKPYLNKSRLREAYRLFYERKKVNEEIQLIDCLQLCDKRDIVLSVKDMYTILPFPSKNKMRDYFRRIESLRNDLAHAQDFIGKFTKEEIIDLVLHTEKVLRILEEELLGG